MPKTALVQNHGVDTGAGEFTEQGVQIATPQGPVGYGVIERHDKQASVTLPEKASQAETSSERSVVYSHCVLPL